MAATSVRNEEIRATMRVSDFEPSSVAAKPHLVLLDRRGNPSCSTMSAEELSELATATRTPFFSIARMNRKRQYQRISSLVEHHGWQGITLVDQRVHDTMPAPFAQPFEPIELNVDDAAARTLLGDTTIRKSLGEKLLTAWLIVLVAAMIVGVGLQLWMSPSRVRTLGYLFMMLVPVPLVIVAFRFYRRRRSRWFLVPAGVYIADGLQPGMQPAQHIKREEATAAFVGFGRNRNHHWFFVELWLRERRIYHVVSRTDALAFIAAWRSPLPPPDERQLAEVAA